MVAEDKRFPELAQSIYRAGRGRGAEVVAPLLDLHRDRFSKAHVNVASRDLADMFVSLAISETQIYALIALETMPVLMESAHDRVGAMVDLFLYGLTS